MSSLNEGEALRQALLEAVQGIEPSADGLRRIRARLSPPRPMALAWAEAASTFVQTRGPSALQEFGEWLRASIGETWARFGPRSGTSGGRASRAAIGWLRPVAALGVTVFIVAAGVYGAISAQQGISSSASSNSPRSNGGAGGGGGSHGGGGGQSTLGQPTSFGSHGSTGATNRPACKPRRSGPVSSSSSSTGPSTSSSASSSSSSAGASASPSVTAGSPTPGVNTTGLTSPPASGGVPATGSTSPAAGSHGAGSPAPSATSGQSHCAVRHHRSRSSPGPTPSASPADISYGKLDDGI